MSFNGDQVKVASYALVGGIALLGWGIKSFRMRRKLEDTARSKIASAAQGLTEVEGQAWPTVLRKGMDGRPVCYWNIEVQELRSHGRGNSRWTTVYSYVSSEDFIILDETGACLVQPLSAQLEVLKTTVKASKMSSSQLEFLLEGAPMAARYLDGVETGLWAKLVSSNVRVVERKILAGGPVYAQGYFFSSQAQTHAVAVGDIQSYASQLKRFNLKSYQMTMFDSNRDGRITEEELANGYSMAASAFLRPGGEQTVRVFGRMTSDSEHGLLLSDTHQGFLLARKSWSSLAMLAGAAAATLGIFMLLQIFSAN